MARKRGETGFNAQVSLPWPLGLGVSIAGFLVVRYGFAWWLSQRGSMLTQGIAQQSESTLTPLAWIVLLVYWMAVLFSFLGARHRRRLMDTRTTLESLAASGCRQFELLVGEAFSRQGHSAEETGPGSADSGIDLIPRKDGCRTLVKCTRWKRPQVGVSVLRKMYGLLAHHQARTVKIICVGNYAKDATGFAQGKPIELISDQQFLVIIQAAQRYGATRSFPMPRIEPALAPAIETATQAPGARRCGNAVVQRANRRMGDTSLGSSQFPRCLGSG